MTKRNHHAPSALLQKHEDGDFLRAVAENVLQLIMEADVDGMIGASRHERSDGRVTRFLRAGRTARTGRNST